MVCKPALLLRFLFLATCVFSSCQAHVQYKVEEIERVVTAQEGKQYVVEACVATTATYGDRMRSIIQMR